MRRYMLIALLVLLAGCLYASRAEAVGFVNVDIFSDFTPTKAGCPPTCPTTDGFPYSGPVGSFTSPDVKFGTNTGFNWHPLGQTGSFGADIKGPLNVSSPGTYMFGLTSDDGSTLRIDGNPIPLINNGGAHSQQSISNSVLLTAGIHSFEVRFFECCGGPSGVDLDVPEGIALTPEPSTLLLMAPGMIGVAWYWRRRKIA